VRACDPIVDVVPMLDCERSLAYLSRGRQDLVRSALVTDILDRIPLLCDLSSPDSRDAAICSTGRSALSSPL
jgi:hypothetical protein